MDRKTLILRLRKLLNLAKSGNEHESESAKRLAHAFRKRHKITDDELDDSEEQGAVYTLVGEKWLTHWRIMLLKFVTVPLEVAVSRYGTGGETRVILRGYQGKCLDAIYAYDYFERKIEERSDNPKDWIDPIPAFIAEINDHKRGMAVTVGKRWREHCETKSAESPKGQDFRLTWTPAPANGSVTETIHIPRYQYKNAYHHGLEDAEDIPMPSKRPKSVKNPPAYV